MDFFGIGAAVRGAAVTYFRCARRTGRTTSLLESLKDGDRVVFTNDNERRRVEGLCRERSLKVDCVVCPVNNPGKLFEKGTPKGRTIFDHSWVEDFYLKGIESMEDHLDHLQRELSGYGSAHIETRRRAEEIMRWRS